MTIKKVTSTAVATAWFGGHVIIQVGVRVLRCKIESHGTAQLDPVPVPRCALKSLLQTVRRFIMRRTMVIVLVASLAFPKGSIAVAVALARLVAVFSTSNKELSISGHVLQLLPAVVRGCAGSVQQHRPTHGNMCYCRSRETVRLPPGSTS